MKQHTQMHESAKTRIEELEKQVQDLKNQTSRSPTPSREPMTPRRSTATHPRSPRSPHFAVEEQPETDDLQIVVGGWSDARKSEAFEEVRHMLANVGHPDCCAELWAPASRTNFVRLTLAFPDGNAHISALRTFQKKSFLRESPILSRVQGGRA